VIQEVAKTYYNLRDYENAYLYYKKLMDERERQNFYLFVHEDIKIAWVCKELGYKEKAEELFDEYKTYAENDQSIYQPLLMSGYYTYIEDKEQALEQLRKFSEVEGFHIWSLFLPNEPHMQYITNEPEFIEIMEKLETKFWLHHEELKVKLLEEGLI
jgi:tetratricopeptide (TPR) repeat protein